MNNVSQKSDLSGWLKQLLLPAMMLLAGAIAASFSSPIYTNLLFKKNSNPQIAVPDFHP